MKLGYLAKSIEIEGDIRLSLWGDKDEELEVVYLRNVYGLAGEKAVQNWKNKTVKYMFAGTDGFLHIEVKED